LEAAKDQGGLEMKPTGSLTSASGFFFALLLGAACPAWPGHIGQLTGDYLFEERESRAVFLATIYEEDGKLYALTDIADDPGELVPLKSVDNSYSVVFRRGGDFTFEFEGLSDGRFSSLIMKSNSTGWKGRGKRFEPEYAKLRSRCGGNPGRYVYRVPLELQDGIETASMRTAGIDTSLLYQLMDDIQANHDYMHSVLIIKDGKLIFEEYMNGWDPARLHRVQSVTKSFTSTVVGLAIREGLIESVDDPVSKYLPEYSSYFKGPKNDVLIRHLLTMSAGFEWNERETYYADPEKCDPHLAEAGEDYIKYVLEKPIVTEPGSVYYYNSGYPNILGYIVEQESGSNIVEFACEHLFEPLGIRRCYWQPITGEDKPGCAGGLRLTSRDLAKYGCLYLDHGAWRGEQLVPAAWIDESTKRQIDADHGKGYGYLWPSIPAGNLNIVFASGTGGQYVAYIPALNSVVVTTAIFSTDKSDVVAGLLLQYVVPALAAGG
jgi:CubicO group peptidase (beta-lactamase class C family)